MELIHFQYYWWIIISLLAGTLTFLLFVQGGQSMLYSLGKTSDERDLIINTLGHKWEYTFTTLVVFGGAFFASFPLFYATSFGGAYVVWILILFSFVIQAVSYEYRKKPNNFLGSRTYELFLQINGYVGPFLIGAAVATFFTGSPFKLNHMMQVEWTTPWRGVDALFVITNYFLAFGVLFLTRALALLYLIKLINDQTLIDRCRKKLIPNASIAVLMLVIFLIIIFFSNGFGVMPDGNVQYVPYKYFQNLIEVPVNSIILLAGIVLVLWGFVFTIICSNYRNGIWFSGLGTILTVTALFGLATYNNTAFYPSTADLNSSLTIVNASSSLYTLETMSWVSLAVPFVIAYMWYAWRAISKGGMNMKQLESEDHTY